MIVTWSGHKPLARNRLRYKARSYKQAPIQMCQWIAQELDWGIEHGWRPEYPVTSGYRPGPDPHTSTGVSNHQGTSFNNGVTPCGAIDFGGYVSPAGKRTKLALIALASRLHYKPQTAGAFLKAPIGFNDDGHCSGNGH